LLPLILRRMDGRIGSVTRRRRERLPNGNFDVLAPAELLKTRSTFPLLQILKPEKCYPADGSALPRFQRSSRWSFSAARRRLRRQSPSSIGTLICRACRGR